MSISSKKKVEGDPARIERGLRERKKKITAAMKSRNDHVALFHLGVVNTHLKLYKEAIQDYSDAIDLSPRFYQAFINRGRLFSEMKMYPNCISDSTEAIKITEGNITAYNNRAFAYFKTRQFSKAKDDYSMVLKMKPNDRFAPRNIAQCEKFMKSSELVEYEGPQIKILEAKLEKEVIEINVLIPPEINPSDDPLNVTKKVKIEGRLCEMRNVVKKDYKNQSMITVIVDFPTTTMLEGEVSLELELNSEKNRTFTVSKDRVLRIPPNYNNENVLEVLQQKNFELREENRKLKEDITRKSRKSEEDNLELNILPSQALSESDGKISRLFDELDLEDIENVSPSYVYRKKNMLDYKDKIHELVFFDRGIDKTFKILPDIINEKKDVFVETLKVSLEEDETLSKFVEGITKRYQPTWKELPIGDISKAREFVRSISEEVSKFFGAFESGLEGKVKEMLLLKRSGTKTNMMLLGDFKGCGVCRHRSILFKLLCDIIGIPCRLIRGNLMSSDGLHRHAWNQTRMDDIIFLVDTVHPKLIFEADDSRYSHNNMEPSFIHSNLCRIQMGEYMSFGKLNSTFEEYSREEQVAIEICEVEQNDSRIIELLYILVIVCRTCLHLDRSGLTIEAFKPLEHVLVKYNKYVKEVEDVKVFGHKIRSSSRSTGIGVQIIQEMISMIGIFKFYPGLRMLRKSEEEEGEGEIDSTPSFEEVIRILRKHLAFFMEQKKRRMEDSEIREKNRYGRIVCNANCDGEVTFDRESMTISHECTAKSRNATHVRKSIHEFNLYHILKGKDDGFFEKHKMSSERLASDWECDFESCKKLKIGNKATIKIGRRTIDFVVDLT